MRWRIGGIPMVGYGCSNGAGGDGGRDAWVEDERTALEFKSFTTLGSAQRRQIERSLARAAEQEPLRWIVIAPVKLTPTGWDWFDQLRQRYPFELIFRDVAWLNTQLAEHADIARYVGTRSHEEVVSLLQGLHKGPAALASGVPDLAERVTDLRGLAAEASPFWTLEFTGTTDTTEIAIRPKPGSPPDHLVIELAQRPESAAVSRLMQQAVLYGTGAELAPEDIARIDSASLRALGVPDGDLSFIMPANSIRDGLPLPALLRVRPTDGTPPTRPLNLNFDAGVIGDRGGILLGPRCNRSP